MAANESGTNEVATPEPPAPLATDALAAARGGTSLLVLQSVGRLIGVAFILVTTRHLAPGELGRYSTVAAIVLFANFLADFGTSPAITRLSSRSPEEAGDLLSGTLPASLALGVLAYLGAVGFAMVAYSGPTVVDVALGGLAIPAGSVLSSVLGSLDGVGLLTRRTAVVCLQTVVVASGAGFVVLGGGARALVLALTAGPWLALAVAVVMARRAGVWRRPHVDPARTRAVLRTALPFALSGGLSALTMRFDVILLSVVRTGSETATYDLALRLLESAAYLGTAVCGPLLFILSRRIGRGDRDGAERAYAEAVRVIYLLGLPVSVVLVVLARPIVSLTLGSSYTGVAGPLAAMGAAQWLAFLVVAQGALVMAGNDVRRGVGVGIRIAGLTVALDLVLVPRYGMGGAAAAMIVSWLYGAWALGRLHRRTIGISTPLPSLSLLAATAGLALVLIGLRQAPLAVVLPLGAATYAGGLLLTGAVRSGDLHRLGAVVGRAR